MATAPGQEGNAESFGKANLETHDLANSPISKKGFAFDYNADIIHTTLLRSSSVPGRTAALYVGGLKIDQRSVAWAKAVEPGNEIVVLRDQF